MSRNNDVSKILVTTGNQDILAAGGTLDTLAIGQIGIFDEKTKVSVDETSTPPQGVFFAVGVDKDADAVVDDIEVSAGQYIQVKGTQFLNYRPHTPAQNLIVDVTGYGAGECDADYSFTVEFRDQEIYMLQGYNQFKKTYSVRTPCCVGSQTSVDGNDIAILLKDAVVVDDLDRVASATLVARQVLDGVTPALSQAYAAGDEVSDADIALMTAYNLANPGSEVYVDVRIEFSSLALQAWCNVNLKHFHPRRVNAIVSVLEDLVCIGGTTSEAQALVHEEGSGYDIQQKEYHSQLNSLGSPYVLSTATGTAKANSFYADRAVKYDQFSIEYDFGSKSGWLDYNSPISTIVAVPGADSVTLDALVAAIDVIFGGLGFDELTSDVTAADHNPANIELTQDKGVDDDGLT